LITGDVKTLGSSDASMKDLAGRPDKEVLTSIEGGRTRDPRHGRTLGFGLYDADGEGV
jgi:hypothetical protein